MQTFFRRLTKFKANSFTLVELLVVISIIGLLAGLAVPAINGGLERAKAQADVANVRQLGILFSAEADDNGGIFRRNKDLTNTDTLDTTLNIYKGAIGDKLVTALKVFAGSTPAGVTVALNSNSFTEKNVAYAYGGGCDRGDDPEIPLFVTKGNSTSFGTADVSLDKTKSPWRDKGITVYRLGGDALFQRSRDGTKIVNAITTNKPTWAQAKIQDP